MKRKNFLTALLSIALIFAIGTNQTNAQQVIAKWVDQSDELPGMVSDGEMALLIGGAAVLITGLVVLIVVKKKQDKKIEGFMDDFNKINSLGLTTETKTSSFYEEVQKASLESPVQFFATCDGWQNNLYNNNQAVSFGVKIKF